MSPPILRSQSPTRAEGEVGQSDMETGREISIGPLLIEDPDGECRICLQPGGRHWSVPHVFGGTSEGAAQAPDPAL
jgi:hypothetical protein